MTTTERMTMRRQRARRHATMLAAGLLAGCLVLTGCQESSTAEGSSAVVRVPGDTATIGAAMEEVAPGGLVLVEPGTYPEEVTIDVENVTLRGTDRNQVIIDGAGVRSFGVVATADGVRIENLTVHSALFYGVLVTSMHDESGPLAHGGPGYTELDPAEFPPLERFAVDHVTAYNNGLYGIYAFNARHGRIADSYASGSADSGFYVGQCEECDVLVTGNVAERNAIGFENANASDSVMIAGNRFSGNRIGMTLISNYQEAFTPQRANVVVGNLISANTSAESPAHALGGFGIGVGINGGQDNVLENNRIENNPAAGVLLTNTEDLPASGNVLRAGVLGGNGVDLVDGSADRAPSAGNCHEGLDGASTSPESLADAVCPEGTADGGGGQLIEVEVPQGISFLQVPAPPEQPGMPVDEHVPDPLPAQVSMPDPVEFEVPEPGFLADRAGMA
ncbi:right-handed parallel beta-helix repeat-containing protein [Ruania halotolerans]|uniref:right-handed parallel beta-helix repeat-containing protein n=1 Tax=Ruania halotolerans TaxID=2897773 RepID=UPI001E5974FC|nr:right-handed parallel beta-helix repeat-containing protein [Ruania halotolerans]UFU06795.1 right-handed parallel beta-helix repeat-containing protein [Ruania halotolerans]